MNLVSRRTLSYVRSQALVGREVSRDWSLSRAKNALAVQPAVCWRLNGEPRRTTAEGAQLSSAMPRDEETRGTARARVLLQDDVVSGQGSQTAMHGHRLQTATFARYTEGRLGPPKSLLGDEDRPPDVWTIGTTDRQHGALSARVRKQASRSPSPVKRISKERHTRSRNVARDRTQPTRVSSSGITNAQPRENARIHARIQCIQSQIQSDTGSRVGHSGAQVCSA